MVIRPILSACSVNQRLPSGPATMPLGLLPGAMPTENSVTTPAVVIRPIRLPSYSVNQRLPSGPARCRRARHAADADRELGDHASVVIRPIRLPSVSVNQRLPSGPAVMIVEAAVAGDAGENSVTTPAGVMRPIRLPSPR